MVGLRLQVVGAEDLSVDLRLNPQPPPVFEVDTIVVASAASNRGGFGATRFSGQGLQALPYRTGGVESVAALAPPFGRYVGALGLTTEETGVTVDGVPFYRAPHPTALFDADPLPLFPVVAVEGISASALSQDISWMGAPGGYLSLTTGAGTREPLQVSGSYGGGPLWASNRLDGDLPSTQSYEGAVQSVLPLAREGASLAFVGNLLRHQTPRPVRLGEGVASDLGALPPEILNALAQPSLETLSRYSGLIRLDLDNGASGQTFFRAGGSFTRRDFDDAAPLPHQPGLPHDEESIDLSFAGGWLTPIGERTFFGLRGGVSGSVRDFEPDAGVLAPGQLLRSGSLLGGPSHAVGESSRIDVTLMPTISHSSGSTYLEGGLAVRATDHTMSRGADGSSVYMFDDASALTAERGYFEGISSSEASFGTRELGVFAQYRTRLASRLRMRLGARLDIELVGSDRPTLSTAWRAATGLANDVYPGTFYQTGFEGEVTWTSGTGATDLTAGGSVRDGDVDPRGLYEALSLSGTASTVHYAGSGVEWPDGAVPAGAAGLPTLALLGPGLRAPRSATMFLGLRQAVTPSTRMLLQATLRRTDFLMRRRNLNLPVTPQFVDPNGRAVYGTLEKDGALVTATGDDSRRFSSSGPVWALDPDGWSEYRGVTVAVEHTTAAIDLFGSYTWSETTDNRLGVVGTTTEASLRPLLPIVDDQEPEWSEGLSDLDAPHRVVGGLTARAGAVELSGVYRFSSGLPFTPRYRVGVDANGDGSVRNDVAFVPADGALDTLGDSWPCLLEQSGGFAVRNSCRAPSEHSLDLRARVHVGSFGGRRVSLEVDGLNLVESKGGILDEALLLVDPAAPLTTSGSTVTIPTTVNPAFGEVLYATSRGTMVRITLRVGT